jgi:DNA-binding transcriptional LysR family regulator
MFRSMKIFATVSEAGSYTAAAHRLGMTLGYVSRSVSELESYLRTRLLNRTTRCIALTEPGERYLQRCYAIMAAVAEAEAEASDALGKPVGTLRVHAMSSLGQKCVVPAIAAYQKRYPAVTVDLTLSQNVPDLLTEGYDVALRITSASLPASPYIARRLGTFHSFLCASPRYLNVHGMPNTVEQLAQHTCLQVAMPLFAADRWILQSVDGEREFALPDGRFRVNELDAMADALQEGMGIGALPAFSVKSLIRSGALIRVMPSYHLQTMNLFAVYASREYLDTKTKTWIEFLVEWMEGALSTDDEEMRGLSTGRESAADICDAVYHAEVR